MNKGGHEHRGKQRRMNRKSCQGRREYVHSRNSRGIKIHSEKNAKTVKTPLSALGHRCPVGGCAALGAETIFSAADFEQNIAHFTSQL